MLRGIRSSSGNFISMLAVAIILVTVFSVFLLPLLRQVPIVEITDCSLASDTITNSGLTAITFTMKSNDKNETHAMRVEFTSHPLVSFKLGSDNLPTSGGVWYFTDILTPAASHTQLINVQATLETGIAKIVYRITVNFLMDGTQIYSKSLDLTVQR
jgi:hypothetical protein